RASGKGVERVTLALHPCSGRPPDSAGDAEGSSRAMKAQTIAPAVLPVLLVLGGVGSLFWRAALGPATSASQILLAGGAVGSLAWSPDGKRLAAGVAITAMRENGS